MSRFFAPQIQLFDASGAAASAGTLTFFAQGTTTLQNTFQDAARTLANKNPVTVNGSGLSPVIYLQYLDYSVLAQDSDGKTLWEEDFDGRWLQDGSDYTRTGTGAIARTVQSRLEEKISVLDFGAVADGVTDTSAAINLALAAAKAVGGAIVHVPANLNKYFCGSTTVAIPSQCELQGDGVEQTVLEFNTTSATCIQLGESASPENSIKAKGFTILNAAATAGTSVGVKVTDNTRNSVFVEDVQIGQFSGEQFGTGFSLGISCLGFTATRMKVFHSTNSFEIKQGNNIIDFYNCWFKSNGGASTTAGTIDAVAALTNSAINFYTCGFEFHGLNGITADGGTGTIHDLNFFGCYFESNGAYHAEFTKCTSANFHGGYFTLNDFMTTGILYKTTSRGVVVGPSVNNIAAGGFFLKALAGNRVTVLYINDIQDSGREFDETNGAANSAGIVLATTSDIGIFTEGIRFDNGTNTLILDLSVGAGNVKLTTPTNRGLLLAGNLGIGGDSVAVNVNTPSGATANSWELKDETGATIGFIPVYGSAW